LSGLGGLDIFYQLAQNLPLILNSVMWGVLMFALVKILWGIYLFSSRIIHYDDFITRIFTAGLVISALFLIKWLFNMGWDI